MPQSRSKKLLSRGYFFAITAPASALLVWVNFGLWSSRSTMVSIFPLDVLSLVSGWVVSFYYEWIALVLFYVLCRSLYRRTAKMKRWRFGSVLQLLVCNIATTIFCDWYFALQNLLNDTHLSYFYVTNLALNIVFAQPLLYDLYRALHWLRARSTGLFRKGKHAADRSLADWVNVQLDRYRRVTPRSYD
jgi:hypothetical protein